MNALQPALAPNNTGPRLCTGVSPAILAKIYDNAVNLCIWERECDPAINHYARLVGEKGVLRDIRRSLRPADARQLLDGALPDMAGKVLICQDILLLVDLFSTLFELEKVGLRIAVLSAAMCPRFHTDHVPCRLVCTYGNPGTQWLPEEALDRSKLGIGSVGRDDAESGIYDQESSIRQLAAGHVGLLKGEVWEGVLRYRTPLSPHRSSGFPAAAHPGLRLKTRKRGS